MVCLACLLPLFLVPIVNILPLLFGYIMAKIYALFGWEYRKPVRTPLACPYKPPAAKTNGTVGAESEPASMDTVTRPIEAVDSKNDKTE